MNAHDLLTEYKDGKRDFSFADLRFAGLRNADLRFADFSNADFSDADLRGACLEHNKTVIYACLGGYVMFMNEREGKLMVKAGCRYFDVAEAREHWAEGNESEWSEKTAEYGQRQRDMLVFLVVQAVALNWESANTYRQG